MKIFVASSYKNSKQEDFVILLRQYGHEVFDFKAIDEPGKPFSWLGVDANYRSWTMQDFKQQLISPDILSRYQKSFEFMQWADMCILLNPSGNSSHMIAGWFIGNGKKCLILLDEISEPEIMYKLAGFNIAVSVNEAIAMLQFC